MDSPSRKHWRVWWWGPLVAAIILVLRWYVDPKADESLTLTAAWQVSQGLVLYRDFFEFHPPGTFYLFGALFALVGPWYAAAKILLAALTLATAVVLDHVVRLFTRRVWHRLAVQLTWIIGWWQIAPLSYQTMGHLASIWAAYPLVRAWQSHRRRQTGNGWFAIAGLATAAVAWFMQPHGAVLAVIGGGMAVATRRWQPLFAYAGTLVAGLFPLLWWPLPTLWHFLVVFPLTYYTPANLAYGGPGGLVFLITFVVLTGATAMVSQRVLVGFGPLWWIAVLLPLSVWPHSQIGYLTAVAWPLPVLLVALPRAPRASAATSAWQRGAAIAWRGLQIMTGTGVVALAVLSVSLSIALLPARDPLGLRVPFWDDLGAAVRARVTRGEPFFAMPYLPAVYFFAERPNATRHNSLQTAFHPAYFQDEIITAGADAAAPGGP